MARVLTAANVDADRAGRMLTDAATASPAELRAIQALVTELAGGVTEATPEALESATFRDVAERWVSGELARLYPDHVRAKRSADRDGDRLDALYPTIGNVPIAAFALADAERAMASLPSGRASATRRHYAQLIAKVLKIAVYPLRLIEASPIPAGWLPKIRRTKSLTFVHPAEDAALLACAAVPLPRRVLWGLLTREGLRLSEALTLRWRDVAKGAITLSRTKTDEGRAWASSPGTAEALAAFRPEGVDDSELVFALGAVRPEELRADLGAAGVTRPELFEKSPHRQPIRVHDLRGTFVTLSLANGKTETWVADRTGHRSSIMINRYRRAARTAAELGLGPLAPLNEAIPELARGPGNGPAGGPKTRRPLGGTADAGDLKSSRRGIPNDGTAENMPLPDAGWPTNAHDGGHSGPPFGPPNSVETALALALERASAAGEWALVSELARLLARRT